jgi:hypothetical protein
MGSRLVAHIPYSTRHACEIVPRTCHNKPRLLPEYFQEVGRCHDNKVANDQSRRLQPVRGTSMGYCRPLTDRRKSPIEIQLMYSMGRFHNRLQP